MFQALNKNGELVTLASLTKEEIEQIRKQEQFFCPECHDLVIVRAGPHVTPHFAHYHTSHCTFSTNGETDDHRNAKLLLYQWLRDQQINAKLEFFIPEINQRPDIFFSYKQKLFVFEFQYSLTDLTSIQKRNEGYRKNGIIPIWFLDIRLLKSLSTNVLQLNDWTLQFMHQFSHQLPTTLYFYDVNNNCLTTITDIHLINRRRAIASFTEKKLSQLTFRKIFSNKRLDKQALFKVWHKEKRNFRLAAYQVYGKELKWRKWLYQRRQFIDYLPSIIHLPIPNQHFFNVPPWYWQSHFIIDFLDPIPIGQNISLTQMKRFLSPFLYKKNEYPLLPQNDFPFIPYLQLLNDLNYVERVDNETFMKKRKIQFYHHIEKAIIGDDELLLYFMYNHT